MTRCDMCGYNWPDRDDDGNTVGPPYCHYVGPAQWAPCEQDDDQDD